MFYGLGKYSIHGAHIWVYFLFLLLKFSLVGVKLCFLDLRKLSNTRMMPAWHQTRKGKGPRSIWKPPWATQMPQLKQFFSKVAASFTLENQLRRDSGARSEPPTVLPLPVLPCQNLPVAPDPYLTSSQTRARTRRLLAGKPNYWMLTSWEEADWDAISHQVRFHRGKFNQEVSDPPTWQDKSRCFCQSYQNCDWAKCQELLKGSNRGC